MTKTYIKGGVHSQDGDTIQTLPPQQSTILNITTSGVSANGALPSGAAVVRIAASEDCWIKFGGSGVTATTSDIFFPAGTEVLAVPRDSADALHTYIAAIQETTGGKVNVVRMGS